MWRPIFMSSFPRLRSTQPESQSSSSVMNRESSEIVLPTGLSGSFGIGNPQLAAPFQLEDYHLVQLDFRHYQLGRITGHLQTQSLQRQPCALHLELIELDSDAANRVHFFQIEIIFDVIPRDGSRNNRRRVIE